MTGKINFIAFSFVMLLVSSLTNAAVLGSADFEESGLGFDFNTQAEWVTGFTCSADPDNVLSGDPSNLCTGTARVCPGTVVTVTPQIVTSRWAMDSFSATSFYPTSCGVDCPDIMIPYATFNSNRNIEWLPEAVFDSEQSLGERDGWTSDSAHHSTLGSFYTQSVTYRSFGTPYSGMRGGANIFCKGEIQIAAEVGGVGSGYGNRALVGSGTITTSSVDVPLNTVGSNIIISRLTDAECFAAVVAHPITPPEDPGFFMLSYYTVAPSVPEARETSIITVTEGVCSLIRESMAADGTLSPSTPILLWITVDNDGDLPAAPIDASTPTAGFTVAPLDESYCDLLGILPGFCPSSGFGPAIAPGFSRPLAIYVGQDAPGPSCPEVCIEYECGSGGCGPAGPPDPLCIDLCEANSCDIDPSTADMPQGEAVDFTVECLDLTGATTPCPGSSEWFFGGAITGRFVGPTTTSAATAVSDDPIGTTGTLNYNCGEGCTACSSDLVVVESSLDCVISPSGADLGIGDSEDFEVVCTYDDVYIDPDDPDLDADWSLEDGLVGDLDDRGTHGATVTATTDSEGNLVVSVTYRGITVYPSAPIRTGDYVIDDDVDPEDDESDTEWCEIHPSYLEGPTHTTKFVTIMCGPPGARVPCTPGSVHWTSAPLGIIRLIERVDRDHLIKALVITGDAGSFTRLIAEIDGDPDQRCSTVVEVTEPDCIEYS